MRRSPSTSVPAALVLSVWLAGTAAAAQDAARPRRYAVIVANNRSLDEGVPPLSWAADDGAKYYELFAAVGAQVALLTVLDAQGQKRFVDATRHARPPSRRELDEALEATFGLIAADREAGRETHFYFVYSGHGNLGPNREGYLNLLDARLGRSDFYREVLARSPATFNHVILDACQSYFLVMKRGAVEREGDHRAAVRDFLRSEDLASHPNTGVILASGSDAETHEWGRWESGIFSHELRSALLGAADVDADGRTTYDEAAAFVEAANAAIDVPRARLRVFYRPPAMRADVALFDLADLEEVPFLQLPAGQAGRYHLEDRRAVRIADFHPSGEQPVRVALLGEAPFHLRSAEGEAVIQGEAELGQLTFRPLTAVAKGGIEDSFRRHLFALPFGTGFFRGIAIAREREEAELRLQVQTARPPAPRSAHKTWGWGFVTAGGATAIGAGVAYGLASASHRDYEAATTPQRARELRETTEDRLLASRLLLGSAGALVLTGGVLHLIDWNERRAIAPVLVTDGSTLGAGVSMRW